jgi:hypothetical protein
MRGTVAARRTATVDVAATLTVVAARAEEARSSSS